MTTKNWTGREFDASEEHIAARPAIRVRQAIQMPSSTVPGTALASPHAGPSALRIFQPLRISSNGHQCSGTPAFRNPSAI